MKATMTTTWRAGFALAIAFLGYGVPASAQYAPTGAAPRLGQGTSQYLPPVGTPSTRPFRDFGLRQVQDTPGDLAPLPPLTPPAPGSGTSATDASTASDTDLFLPRAEREGGGGEPTIAQQAEEEAEEPEKDETKLLMNFLGIEDSKIKIYGWFQNSYTGNTNGVPQNGLNFGVNPNYLANRYMINQFYIILERPLEQTDEINFGFRMDNLLGNDWQFNYMQGFLNNVFNNNRLGYDIAQFYAEMHLPDPFLGTGGVDVKVGRFYTLAGYEVVPATGRPLLSVPYMFNYGQPFTHTGVLTTWHVNERLNVYNGVINGWDRWINEHYKMGYIGGFAYTFKNDKTSFAFTTVWGPNQFPRQLPNGQSIYPTGYVNIPSLAGAPNRGYSANDRVLFTSVLSHKWTDKLTQVVESDQAQEQNVPGLGAPVVNGVVQNGTSKDASWYSFGNWFLYKFNADNDKLTGVWRSEIFRDHNGARTGTSTNYSEFTLGLIYKPVPYLWIRPEARYDFTRNAKVYNDNTRDSQFTIGLDAILLF